VIHHEDMLMTDYRPALPPDAVLLYELHASLCESRQARPSIRERLALTGRLWRLGATEYSTRAHYIAALNEWAADAGIPVESVSPGRESRNVLGSIERHQDETNARARRAMKGSQ
jgi:hypothetical protein